MVGLTLDPPQRAESSLVRGRQGVYVLAGGRDGGVPEPVADDLQVRAPGEQPGCVGVAQVVQAWSGIEPGRGAGGEPDTQSEPVPRQVPVGVAFAWASGGVLTGGTSVGAVPGEGGSAVHTTASAGGVGGQGRVRVSTPRGVGRGRAELVGVEQPPPCRCGLVELVELEEQTVGGQFVGAHVGLDRGDQGRVELEPARVLGLRVGLDVEAVTGRVEPGAGLAHRPADGQDPAGQVQVPRAQLDELTPAKARADRELDEQPRRIVRQLQVEPGVLLGGQDPVLLDRDGRGLHPTAGVDDGDEVVECGREDRRQDDLQVADVRRGDSVRAELGDPLAHVGGQDVAHLHRPEPGQQVTVQDVAVALSGRGLEHMVGEPLVVDVACEGDLPARGVAGAARGLQDLGCLPRLVCLLARGVGADLADPSARVAVHRGVANPTLGVGPLAREAHDDNLPTNIICHQFAIKLDGTRQY